MSNRVKTLHEAMVMVLTTMPEKTGTYQDVSDEIARRDLWVRPKDGKHPEAFQIGLRARRKTYSNLFEDLDGDSVRLRI